MKIYRECTKEPYNFLTIDTMLPVSDPLRFREKLSDPHKNDINPHIHEIFLQRYCMKWVRDPLKEMIN